MFTPFLDLSFVHAVRTPNPPASTAAAATRESGKTYALFADTIDVDFQGARTGSARDLDDPLRRRCLSGGSGVAPGKR